ncbi:hypothetical protein BRC81_17375 [Halobacteriales archaeon QS_1_68_20]|nr:MAG: hypothetical protein BRC81_17375 [Halobacteriales archaeon QS_1_68_20]
MQSGSVDLAAAESAFEAHAGDVLDLLAEEGLLDGGVAALPTDRAVPVGALVGGPEGVAYFGLADRPDLLKAVKRVDGGVLKVTVKPETGDSHAVFEPADQDVRHFYDPERDGVGVRSTGPSPSAECSCDEVICPYGGGLTRTCCDGDDCWVEECC